MAQAGELYHGPQLNTSTTTKQDLPCELCTFAICLWECLRNGHDIVWRCVVKARTEKDSIGVAKVIVNLTGRRLPVFLFCFVCTRAISLILR